MRILIISDTHRKNENLFKLLDTMEKPDMLIHCGDVEGSEFTLSRCADCPVEMVAGNNDFFSELPREREFEIEGYRVWLTHGHNYYVSMGNELLKQEAAAKGADIVMYGHTHRPVIETDGEVIAINPGSLSYPRQEGRRASYIIMETDEHGEAQFTLHYISDEHRAG